MLLLFLGILTIACNMLDDQPIEHLLIDVTDFPDNWTVDTDSPRSIPSAPLGGTKSIKSIEVYFSSQNDFAFERIRRFKSSEDAASEFARQMKHIFRERKDTQWFTPETISFQSSVAEQSYYACSQAEGYPWPGCTYIAQYGTYFVHFGTGIILGDMSYSDFERVIQAIDERMASSITQ
jgi:hypothetical protein